MRSYVFPLPQEVTECGTGSGRRDETLCGRDGPLIHRHDIMRRGEPVLAQALLAIARHFTLLNTLVWDKVDPGLGWRWRRSWEAIIEASAGKPKVWNGGTQLRNVLRYAKAIPQSDEHPTPKPVPLLEELIRAASPSRGRVLDPFAGAGPTLIAAERTGRTCYAAELEPRYCDIVVARWEALTEGAAVKACALPPVPARRPGGSTN